MKTAFRRCPVTDCTETCTRSQCMCSACWATLPRKARDEHQAAYRKYLRKEIALAEMQAQHRKTVRLASEKAKQRTLF